MTKEEERAKKAGEKVAKEKWCQVCGGKLSRIGATVGGTQLYGCSICHAVYWI